MKVGELLRLLENHDNKDTEITVQLHVTLPNGEQSRTIHPVQTFSTSETGPDKFELHLDVVDLTKTTGTYE